MVTRNKYIVNISKQLRSHLTPWEIILWRHLRGGRFYDVKFKRQVAFENYVVDFCSNEKKLIIELDGSSHQGSLNDKKRDLFFNNLGYKVLRFWNNEVDNNLEGVLEKIKKELNVKD